MRHFALLWGLGVSVLFCKNSFAQSPPELALPASEPTAHIQFLASDEFEGRMTGEHGNDVAARYIATQFAAFGVKPLPNMTGYFQPVPFAKRTPPKNLSITVAGKFIASESLLLLSGSATRFSAPIVYVGFGIADSAAGRDDYAGLDVKDKIVIARFGGSEQDSPRELFLAMNRKQQTAKSKGAKALIELYRYAFPFAQVKQFFGSELTLDDEPSGQANFTHLLLNDSAAAIRNLVQNKARLAATVNSEGYALQKVVSKNIVGFIEGADATLKNEYILLSAHYDHVGVKASPNQSDSIYNGARDNAMGASALLCAAKMFSEQPPKRSILLLACTGEEIGLHGSQYFADHPLLPLKDIVFNLNIDGAGYNDTSIVTVIGLERTSAKQSIIDGCAKMGLGAIDDPAPEQNLFDRSDNVSFAQKGIPAPTFSEGFRSFDAKIAKYYHQARDQADENFDFQYLHRFCKAFIYSARLIADNPTPPQWTPGDKYEPIGKKLYQK
jgi:hypothetical protein